MTSGSEDTTLVLRSISHNMADELTNPICTNPLVCMEFMDQFDYNWRSYYFIKQVGNVVTAYYCLNDEEIKICSNLCTNIRQLQLLILFNQTSG